MHIQRKNLPKIEHMADTKYIIYRERLETIKWTITKKNEEYGDARRLNNGILSTNTPQDNAFRFVHIYGFK